MTEWPGDGIEGRRGGEDRGRKEDEDQERAERDEERKTVRVGEKGVAVGWPW